MALVAMKQVQKKTGSKTIVITGAGNGIGRATSLALARQGHRLGLIDVDAKGLETLATEVDETGSQGITTVADVRDSGAIEESVATIKRELGPIDVLITCAGVGRLSTATTLDIDGLQWMFDINGIRGVGDDDGNPVSQPRANADRRTGRRVRGQERQESTTRPGVSVLGAAWDGFPETAADPRLRPREGSRRTARADDRFLSDRVGQRSATHRERLVIRWVALR